MSKAFLGLSEQKICKLFSDRGLNLPSGFSFDDFREEVRSDLEEAMIGTFVLWHDFSVLIDDSDQEFKVEFDSAEMNAFYDSCLGESLVFKILGSCCDRFSRYGP